MARANYYITGVWKTSGVITHVFMHEVTPTGFKVPGARRTEAEVISLIKNGALVKTLRWKYNNDNNWAIGADVQVVREGTKEYLRTHKDESVSDNLDNMISMSVFL